MTRISLDALVAPLTTDEFLANHWPREPLFIRRPNEAIEALMALPCLQSLEDLLVRWPRAIQVHLPDASDESSAVDATPADARKLFANRMALLFNNAHTISPELEEWLSVLKRDLGLPHSTYARCMVYATPDARGNTAHFDQNVNFVIQLVGVKKWRLAPNVSVENPTQRHVIGQTVDPELASYLEHALPTSMPEGGREYTLEPGSLLFVPRGYWHSTEAEGEALALNFTFSQPSWADLFTMALASRLALSPAWRELADGVSAEDPARRNTAYETLDSLLAELVEDLPNWRASDVLGATEGDVNETPHPRR